MAAAPRMNPPATIGCRAALLILISLAAVTGVAFTTGCGNGGAGTRGQDGSTGGDGGTGHAGGSGGAGGRGGAANGGIAGNGGTGGNGAGGGAGGNGGAGASGAAGTNGASTGGSAGGGAEGTATAERTAAVAARVLQLALGGLEDDAICRRVAHLLEASWASQAVGDGELLERCRAHSELRERGAAFGNWSRWAQMRRQLTLRRAAARSAVNVLR